MKITLTSLLLTIAILGSQQALANPEAEVNPDVVGNAWNCPDADVLSGIVDNFCLDCLLPIALLGQPIPNSDNHPDIASNESIGMCPSAIFFGAELPCLMTGMWEPDKFVEVTRTPWCSLVMGGNRLDSAGSINPDTGEMENDQDAEGERDRNTPLLSFRLGESNQATDDDGSEMAFYHHHIYSNPLSYVLGLTTSECNTGGSEVQLMWMSELLSEWEDDELALQLTPEAGPLSNALVTMSCMADAVKTTFGQPINSLFWCAGTWGTTYPFTGTVAQPFSPIVDYSIATTKALAFNHRLGMAEQSAGNSAYCMNHPNPVLVKGQYKFQQFYPRPEKSSNHWIGALSYTWGEHRSVPAIGEDFLITLWRWNDCCIRIP